MTITYLRRHYPAMAESKKTASKGMQKPIHKFLSSKSMVDNPIDRRMESPAAPLPNDLLALHGTFSTGLFYLLIKNL